MTPKDLTKLAAIICMVFAAIMAIWGAYESFSQSATSHDWDWALRTYLHFGSLTFAGFLFCARNRNESFKFLGIQVKWWLMYFITAFCFYLVSATNVTDYSLSIEDYDQTKVLAHLISTAMVALSASIIVWHYFKKGTARTWARIAVIIGDGIFACSLIDKEDWLTTAIGEAAVTVFILAAVWVMINELIPDKMN